MQIDESQAGSRLDEIIDKALEGENVFFMRDGQEVVQLVPITDNDQDLVE